MDSNLKISLDEFLSFFPEVELPVVLTEESIHEINKRNKALPFAAINRYIKEWETSSDGESEEDADELIEYIACLQFDVAKNIKAIVYWKANLLSYEYYLLTINNKGKLLSSKVIAGLISNGTDIKRSAATIKEDLTIHIVTGNEKDSFSPSESKSFYMEIMPEGSIVSFQEENNLWDQVERKN